MHATNLRGDDVNFITQIQAHVGGHLIVARPPGMQLFARLADALGQARLDIHVHIFQVDRPGEIAALDVEQDAIQPVDDFVALLRRQYADLGQHARMSF